MRLLYMLNFNNYYLVGIGEFSHGIQESWEFRFKLLKHVIKNTNKKVTIFAETSWWIGDNIRNNTIWSRELNKPIKYNGIKKEKPIDSNNGGSAWGVLWQYIGHTSESKILYKIIKYIRKNKNRIIYIGTDNDKIDRDYDMYKIIMKNLNKNHINLFWASNDHVADLPLSSDNLNYIKNKDHKWFCGHYLKEKLKDKYCIVLTQAYRGENRFNGYCKGDNCEERIWQLKYIYKKFVYKPNKKYVDNTKKFQLLTEFDNKLINFSNSYYSGNKYGVQSYIKPSNWNYILFWNEVHRLEPYKEY